MCRDIALQLAEADFDVALGGGRAAFYGKDGKGQRLDAAGDLPRQWIARTGGSYVRTAAELAAAPADKPVLGLFSPSHMTYMVDRAETADSTEPTLTDMTAAAIARLKPDPQGYYLMVEGGRIDHGHHAGQDVVAAPGIAADGEHVAVIGGDQDQRFGRIGVVDRVLDGAREFDRFFQRISGLARVVAVIDPSAFDLSLIHI